MTLIGAAALLLALLGGSAALLLVCDRIGLFDPAERGAEDLAAKGRADQIALYQELIAIDRKAATVTHNMLNRDRAIDRIDGYRKQIARLGKDG